MGLIKFYKIFIKTYKEYNKEKLAAKKCINDTKHEIILLQDKYEKARLVLKYLDDLYLMLPYEKRIKCVQETMDMFKHGTGCRWNESVIKYLEILLNKIKLALNVMADRYSNGEYASIPAYYKDEVVEYIEKYKKDHFIYKNYIKENQS